MALHYSLKEISFFKLFIKIAYEDLLRRSNKTYNQIILETNNQLRHGYPIANLNKFEEALTVMMTEFYGELNSSMMSRTIIETTYRQEHVDLWCALLRNLL